MTASPLATAYADSLRADGISETSLRAYLSDVRLFGEHLRRRGYDPEAPAQWDRQVIASFFAELEGRGAATTRARIASAIRRYFRFLFRTARTPENYAELIPEVKRPGARETGISDAVYRALLEGQKKRGKRGLRDLAILSLIRDTGIRSSQLASLKVQDLDLVVRTIRLGEAEDSEGVMPQIRPFTEETGAYLMQYLHGRRSAEPDYTPEAALFLGRDGKPLSRQSVWKIVRTSVVHAGLEETITPDLLRSEPRARK